MTVYGPEDVLWGWGEIVRPGDVIDGHLIEEVEPYDGPWDGERGDLNGSICVGIARAPDGWGISLWKHADNGSLH